MSSVIEEKCDRCRRKLVGMTINVERVKSTYLFSGEPYKYMTINFSLCEECGKDLERFMKGVRE